LRPTFTPTNNFPSNGIIDVFVPAVVGCWALAVAAPQG
jgi:hypothetical protein